MKVFILHIVAFKIVDLENTGYIQSESFKELLMTLGHRLTEDEADEYMKFIDPKNEGKFLYIDIVKKILKWLLFNIKFIMFRST